MFRCDQGGLALYARVGHLVRVRVRVKVRLRVRVRVRNRVRVLSRIGHLADLSRVELGGPGAAVELGVKGGDVSRRDQIDERIPDVASMAEVDGKVQ